MTKFSSLFPKFSHLRPNFFLYLLYLSLPFALIIPLRATVLIQHFEWLGLDTFLRLRPIEQPDDRVTIIGIDDEDLKYLDRNKELAVDSISDRALARTLEKIAAHHPAAIGIDIIRDRSVSEGRSELEKVAQHYHNIVGIYKAYPPDASQPPTLGLPPAQNGFADQISDEDGRERRAIIAEPQANHYSLAYHLSRLYLANNQIQITAVSNREIKFSNGKVLNSLIPAPGKYDRQDLNNFQTLINYRHHPQPFQKISLRDILTDKYQPQLLKNQVILIGYTTTSSPDFIYTNAIHTASLAGDRVKIPSTLYGVESHAHITSQLISQAIDNRSNLMPLNTIQDMIWLIFCIGWGLILLKFIRIKSTPTLLIISIIIYLLTIVSIAYMLILLGILVSIFDVFLTFIISAPILATIQERQHQLTLLADVRLDTIRIAFENIHAIPLQTIAIHQKSSPPEFRDILDRIDREIRAVGAKLEEQYQHEEELLAPLDELLNLTFDRQINRPQLKYLRSLNLANYIVSFDEIRDDCLTSDNKHQICNFLAEAICNIDKHAIDVTRVWITSDITGNYCYLKIRDNGHTTTQPNHKNNGIKNAEKLARRLHGKFTRELVSPHGYKCTLAWKYHS
jgi:CHASE2 domain-containing sensor protein/two-component sensor histidine kinase